MSEYILENGIVGDLKKETVSLDKARKLWQEAKAVAKSSKTPAMQDLLKAFKSDLGPTLDSMAKTQASIIKAFEAATKAFKSDKLKAIQTLAGYKAAIEARKLQSTPEGAKMMAALKTIQNSIE
jgi:protein-disulfide isomerase-like protein with CxxC motif